MQFRDACDERHKMLLNLINVSLLEESEKMNHERMNKVLRNMALKISSKSKIFKVLVKTREGLQEVYQNCQIATMFQHCSYKEIVT